MKSSGTERQPRTKLWFPRASQVAVFFACLVDRFPPGSQRGHFTSSDYPSRLANLHEPHLRLPNRLPTQLAPLAQ